MNIRSIVVAAVAFAAVSAACADEAARKPAEAKPPPRVETTLAEITANMREVLRAVTPEIALPALEVKLPTLDLVRR